MIKIVLVISGNSKKDIDGNKFYVKVKIVEKKLRQQLSQKKKFIMYAVNQ